MLTNVKRFVTVNHVKRFVTTNYLCCELEPLFVTVVEVIIASALAVAKFAV